MVQTGSPQRPPTILFLFLATAGCFAGCTSPWAFSSFERRDTFFRGQREVEKPNRAPGDSTENGFDALRLHAPNRNLASPDAKPDAPRQQGPVIPRAGTRSDVKLELNVQSEKTRQVGTAATFRVVLKNAGTETLTGLAVECDFEKPLIFPGHPNSIARRSIGTLMPGEKSEMTLSLVSDKPGTFSCEFKVVSGGGKERLWKAVSVTYVPRQTSVRIFAPPTRTVGGRAEMTLQFANVGTTELKELRITATFDGATLKPFDASDGARLQQTQRESTLTWIWKLLKPGEGVPLQVAFDCLKQAARSCVRVTVSSKESPEVEAAACLNIVASRSDWNLRIGDTVDPAKPGDETAVVVLVSNRSRMRARPGRVQIDIPTNFRVVSATVWQGQRLLPVQSVTKGAQVEFDRPMEIAPNTDLTYRVRVKALRGGNTDFQATLLDDTGKPLLKRTEPVGVSG